MIRALLCLALLTPALAFTIHAQTITGLVVSIADGDTLTVLDFLRVEHKIRLSGIDMPEKTQASGNVSRKNLAPPAP